MGTSGASPLSAEHLTLHELLAGAFRRHSDRVALLFGDDALSFAELDRRIDTYAAVLHQAGLRSGGRMAVMGKARPQFVVAVLATLRLGAAVVLVSPAWKSREIRHALTLTQPALVAGDSDTLNGFSAQFAGPVLDLDAVLESSAGALSAPTSIAGQHRADTEAALVFSSGTTGLPKAAMHTHGTLGAATRHWAGALGLGETDRFQIATPPSHILGLLNMFAAIASGSTVRLHERFQIEEILRHIQDDRLTLEMTVAPVALALAEHPDLERFDLRSLRYFMWCATPVVPAVAERVTARTGVPFLTAYGASELPLISANDVNAPGTWRIDTAGRVIDAVEVRVVDPGSGAELPAGSAGEIQARGPSTMVGYLADEGNAEAFADGWYRTGDIGWVEPDGWLHITDRLKEMVKVKGFQVAPAEVEAVLLGHPAVVDCAVFGVPDVDTGEAVVAAVVCDPAHAVSAEELKALILASLARYKQLSRVVFVEAIPRTPSGKVLRRSLRSELTDSDHSRTTGTERQPELSSGDGSAQPMFEGIRVIEVAEWTFVPAAAAVLAEFGADVIKVERPEGGDAQRGLAVAGVSPILNGVALQMEQANRGGKRSVGIDIRTEQGRELIYKLVRDADVFMTSLLPQARRRFGLDFEDIRAVNPGIVYGLGTGFGHRGPDSEQAGYDMTAYWCRGGMAYNLTENDSEGIVKLRPGVGDRVSAMNLVAGIAGALLRKERTGVGAMVEVSLLGSAMWQIAGDIVYSKNLGIENSKVNRGRNPLTGYYRSSDGGWLALACLASDRWWPGFVKATGLTQLLDDPRFSDHHTRDEHYEECCQVLAAAFAEETFAEWRSRLANFAGPWAPVQSSLEVANDVQVAENGYLLTTRTGTGQEVSLVAAPMAIDGPPRRFGPCPDAGADTDAVLLELGESWDQIIDYKVSGAIL